MNIEVALRAVLEEVKGNPAGEFAIRAMSTILDQVPIVPNIPHGLFVALIRKMVPAAVELVIIRENRALLTYRDDSFYNGWHTPGTYIAPGETILQACRRCALREIGVSVQSVKVINCVNHHDDARFHFFSILVLCEIEGEPKTGEWFAECPTDIIATHRTHWRIISSYLNR